MVWEDFSKYDQKWKQQVLGFDFWEEEKKQEAEKLQDQKEKLPHFPEPKNDNEYLLECQWQYRHGDQTALDRMYKKARTLGMKFINAREVLNDSKDGLNKFSPVIKRLKYD